MFWHIIKYSVLLGVLGLFTLTGCSTVARKIHQLTHSKKSTHAYRVVELKTLGGGKTTVAMDINDSGIVVGRSDYLQCHGHSKAVLWTNGVPRDIGSLDNGGSEADRISANGEIIGWSSQNLINIHAVRFSPGKLADLGLSTGVMSLGIATDGIGHILVTADTKNGSIHSYIVSSTGVWTDIGELKGFRNTAVSDINGAGQVIGVSDNANGSKRAFVWDKNNIKPLPLLKGYTDSYAYRLNSSGVIAGACSRGFSHFTSVIWRQGKVMELAATQSLNMGHKADGIIKSPNHKESIAYAINNNGYVVGSCNDEACLWKNGSINDLNIKIPKHPDYVLRQAIAINNAGWIVCNGEKVKNKKRQAYLLIPNDH